MNLILTMTPESDDEMIDVPDDWNVGRRIELHWLCDDRHPCHVVAQVVVQSVTVDVDESRHLHLSTLGGDCG